MATYTFVIHALPRGGAEKVLLMVASGLKARGHTVRVVLFGGEIALNTGSLEVVNLDSSTKGKGPKTALTLLRLILKLRAELKKRTDYIISFGDQNNLITAISKLLLPGKLIVSDRIYPPLGPLLGSRSQFLQKILVGLRDLIYRAAKVVVVPTEEMTKFYNHNKIKVIPNPVELPALSYFSSQSGEVVLAAGRLVPQKRFDLAIEAFSSLKTTWEFRIFGDGPLSHELQSQASTKKAHKISINSATTNLSKEMSEASIFVLSSDFEGFPNVLLEAMAHGLAVIATKCPTGPSSLIRDGHNGILVPCGDKQALAEAIDKLIRDSKLRRELGMRAAETSRDYTLNKVIDAWESL